MHDAYLAPKVTNRLAMQKPALGSMPLDRLQILRADVRNSDIFCHVQAIENTRAGEVTFPRISNCRAITPRLHRSSTAGACRWAALRTLSRGFVVWRFLNAGRPCLWHTVRVWPAGPRKPSQPRTAMRIETVHSVIIRADGFRDNRPSGRSRPNDGFRGIGRPGGSKKPVYRWFTESCDAPVLRQANSTASTK